LDFFSLIRLVEISYRQRLAINAERLRTECLYPSKAKVSGFER